MYKDRISFYDMDAKTSQLYAPIDKYLGQTKRFSPRSMKRKYIIGIIIYSLLILLVGSYVIMSIVLIAIPVTVIVGLFLAALICGLRWHVIHFGENPDPDMVTCENIIGIDGLENIHEDYMNAVEFTKQSVIGEKYIFMRKRTLVRIKNIECAEICEIVESDEDGYIYKYFFNLHINDEMGERDYQIERLSDNEYKREKRYAELMRIFEAKQKAIDTVEI